METTDLAALLLLADGPLLLTAEAVPGATVATHLSQLPSGSTITVR